MSLIEKGPNNFQQKPVNDFVWTHLFGPLLAVLVQSPNPILIALAPEVILRLGSQDTLLSEQVRQQGRINFISQWKLSYFL